MVKLVNKYTGGDMWVHEARVDEYLAAGHKPAAKPETPAKKPAARAKKTAK